MALRLTLSLATLGFLFVPAVQVPRVILLSQITAPGVGELREGSVRFSPDGTSLFYRADQDSDNFDEAYVAPSDGSGEPVLSPFGDTFEFSPDGAWVAYADAAGLRSQPLPSGAPILLAAGAVPTSIQFTADSTRVVYSLAHNTSYVVPVDGSANPIQLTPALAPGETRGLCVLGNDGTRAVYPVTSSSWALFSVPLSGGTPVQISAPLAPGLDLIRNVAFTPDSARVVYTAAHVIVFPQGVSIEDRELYSAPADGSASAVRLNSGAQPGAIVSLPPLSTSNGRVVYVSDEDPLAGFQLYSVPSDGSAASLVLSPLPVDGSVDRTVLDPSGTEVVYVGRPFSGDQTRLFVVPADGSAAPLELSSPTDPGSFVMQVAPLVSPDGTRVAFISYPYLCSVPLDGSSAAIQLSSASTMWSAITPDSTRIVYTAAQDTPGKDEVYSVMLDGSGAALRLNAPFIADGDATALLLSPAGDRVAYTADQEQDSIFEVYSVPIDGSLPAVKMTRLLPGPRAGDVKDFALCGSRAVYLADQESDERSDLFSVPIDGTSPSVKLDGTLPTGGDVGAWAVSESAQRVVYIADQNTDGKDELFSRSVDGSGAPLRLSPTMSATRDIAEFALAPPGQLVAYRGDASAAQELYVVPVDGSTPATRLNGTLVTGGAVAGFRVNATHAVYRADQDVNDVVELYSRPLDGSTPALKLNPTLVAGGDLVDHALSPDGARVVYRADQLTNNVVELFSVPLDGSGPSVRLSAPPAAGGTVYDYAIDPLSARVVYRANPTGGTNRELFGVPLDGTAPPVRLHGPLTGSQSVTDYALDPSGQRVCFRIDPSGAGTRLLLSAPLDGSLGAVFLSNTSVGAYAFDPSGTRVAFVGFVVAENASALFAVSPGGSPPAIRLSPPGIDCISSELLVSGGAVVYRGRAGLYWAPITGGESHPLTPPAPAGELIWTFTDQGPTFLTEGRVVFMAQFRYPLLVELFSSRFSPPTRRR